MKEIIIFSQDSFTATHNNNKFFINKNAHIKISNYNPNEILEINYKNITLHIPLNNLCSNNFYKVFNYKDKQYIEIIATDFNNLLYKYTTKSCEIFIYDNSIRIIKNNKCYSYYFKNGLNNYTIEQYECVYIFNENNLTIFDFNHSTFNSLKVEKFKKNNKFVEFLCKIPNNFNYFLHFIADTQKNTINMKKYKHGEVTTNSQNIFNLFFYLCKHSISDANKFISNNLNFQDLTDYLQKYENILQINDEYFIYNQTELISIDIKIEDGKIIDID